MLVLKGLRLRRGRAGLSLRGLIDDTTLCCEDLEGVVLPGVARIGDDPVLSEGASRTFDLADIVVGLIRIERDASQTRIVVRDRFEYDPTRDLRMEREVPDTALIRTEAALAVHESFLERR